MDRVEISGAAMRMKRLQEIVARAAFPDNPEKQCNSTLNMDECVCRGACLLGEMVYREKSMRVSATTAPFAYNNGSEEVRHEMRVLGYGDAMEGDAGAAVEVVCATKLEEAATEHACEDVGGG